MVEDAVQDDVHVRLPGFVARNTGAGGYLVPIGAAGATDTEEQVATSVCVTSQGTVVAVGRPGYRVDPGALSRLLPGAPPISTLKSSPPSQPADSSSKCHHRAHFRSQAGWKTLIRN